MAAMTDAERIELEKHADVAALSTVIPGYWREHLEEKIKTIHARQIQGQRFADEPGIHCNAQMTPRLLQRYVQLDERARTMLQSAMDRLNLSARAYDRILKVARTIADLDGSDHVQSHHIAEAIGYRSLDRENWGA